jgi:hypothetical protein
MRMAATEINDLFMGLDNRLTSLDRGLYIDLNQTNYFPTPLDLTSIANNLVLFGEIGLKKLTSVLQKVEKLLRKKEGIVHNISFGHGGGMTDPHEKAPEAKKAAQLEFYVILRTELEYYEQSLTEIGRDYRIFTKKNTKSRSEEEETFLRNQSRDVKLDIYQTALLFWYLEEYGIIKTFRQTKLAECIHELTGHSPHTIDRIIRKHEELKTDAQNYVNKTKKTGQKQQSYNLSTIFRLLSAICNDIDDQVVKQKDSQKT